MTPVAKIIVDGVRAVTKGWCKQRKAEERHANAELYRFDRLVRLRQISIKEAAWSVMETAYAAASDDGRLPANARQIMYAARPEILRITGKDRLDDAYFTQILLPDFIEEHPDLCRGWDLVWDARGNFTEPHTGHVVPLGTIEVRSYLGERPQLGPAVDLHVDRLLPTRGPKDRFRAVLFVEKEGFDPLLQAAQIAERFDIAIMSSKGMSTTAARRLLDGLSAEIDKILVLHDFDVSGFSIFGTLGTDNRRYRFENSVPIIDIGLRLADVEAMALQSEPASVSGWEKRRKTLAQHGATSDEITLLRDRRVELNAMSSRRFVDFLDLKLREHGVRKVIPDIHTLQRHSRRLIEQRLTQQAIKAIETQLRQEAASTVMPPDIRGRVKAELCRRPHLSWDAALLDVIQQGPKT